jgi:exonuclease III
MTFFSNKLEIEVTGKITDSEGRFILLKCIIQGTKFIIYNVYAPNNEKDHEAFLLDLKSKLESLDADEYEYLIGAGDWNFTSEKIDRSGGNYTIWQKNTATFDEINDKFDLIDIWRLRNPEKARFTWRRKNPVIQSRLDRFYISDTMQYNVSKTDILPGIRSDHSAIVLSIKPTNGTKQSGPSFWKFNNSLLKNEDFTNGLNII